MSSDYDITRLPEPPPPSRDARDEALMQALARFDQKKSASSQGLPGDIRLIERTAAPLRQSRERPVMNRTRYLVAASLACILAGSGVFLHLSRSAEPQLAALPVERQMASNQAVHAPVTAQEAKKETENRIPSQVVAEQRSDNPAPAPAQPAAAAPLAADASAAVAAPATPPKARPENQVAVLAPSFAPAAPPPPSANEMMRKLAPQAPGPVRSASRSDSGLARALQSAPTRQLAAGDFRNETPRERGPTASEPVGRDQFANAVENAFKVARDAPVSTFSIDVDTASYSFVRASLNRNVLPQPAAVRTEELINYFPYAYEAPASASEPFRANVAVFPNPWSEGRKLMRIGIKGYALREASRPRANLVFLIDTSGSMETPNRLPLVKQSLAMLLTQLQGDDRVAIVTYAGNAGTALEPTAASEKAKILATIERLEARGSTAGAEGIRQAYALAEQNFDANSVNRVILATDGDFNVGITNRDELKGFVERQRAKGIFLSVLGFGVGNYNDALAQALAQNGNGVAAYIDTINEARKVLVEEASSTLFPIGKDVKVQVEFNPATVAEYRLIGYETRLLNRSDFSNDKVDAGDVGSGQTVTALYDIVPAGGPRVVDDLRYSTPSPASGNVASVAEYAFVKIRYKLPKSDQSVLISTPVDRTAEVARFEDAPLDARFATSVAAFGEILRGGKHTGKFSHDDVLRIASAARGDDAYGYRSEFLQLVRAAKTASAMQPQRP
jgi:Ca-activated chloride channel family protein